MKKQGLTEVDGSSPRTTYKMQYNCPAPKPQCTGVIPALVHRWSRVLTGQKEYFVGVSSCEFFAVFMVLILKIIVISNMK